MLRSAVLAALGLGLGLTAASPTHPSIFRRNNFDICPQVGTNVPVPNHNTFQFPLKGFSQSMCWPFCIGDQATCSPQTNICFDFVQYDLTFTYKAIPGFTYTEADIWLGFSAPIGPVIPQYTTANGFCQISAGGSTVTCVIPYQDIVGGTTNLDWLAGMCPNRDSQGLFFFLETNALLLGPNGPVTGEGARSCTDYPTCSSFVPYWELTYRCSFCDIPPPSTSSSSSSVSSTTSSSSSSSSSSISSTTSSSSSSSTTSSSSSSSISSTTSSSSSSSSSSTSSSSSSSSSSTSSSSSSSSSTTTSSSSSSTSSTTTPTSSTTSSSSSSSTSSTTTPTSSTTSSSSSSSTSSTTTPTSSTTTSSRTSTSPTSTPISCELGTAFGYGTNPQAKTLNSQSPLPKTCNRWGWYFTPTAAQLSAGISGPLYVGAGQNDISKAILVGTWSAKLSGGLVSVTYTLQSIYSLAEVHVDLQCTPIPTCAPGQYTYGNTNAAALGSTFTVPGLNLPTCSGGSQVYLIIHAKVNVKVVGPTCPAVAAN